MKLHRSPLLVVVFASLSVVLVVSWVRSHYCLDIVSHATPARRAGLAIRPGQLVFGWTLVKGGSAAPLGFKWHHHRYTAAPTMGPTINGHVTIVDRTQLGSILEDPLAGVRWNVLGFARIAQNGATFSYSGLVVPHWMALGLTLLFPLSVLACAVWRRLSRCTPMPVPDNTAGANTVAVATAR